MPPTLLRYSAVLLLTLVLSCNRSTPDADATHLSSAPAGVDSLGKALDFMGALLDRVGHLLELSPGSDARRLATDSVLIELARVDTMMAPASDEPADSHVMVARHEVREAISSLRKFLAGSADTVTGSPGRNALEMAEEHLKSARNELDQVGGYH